MTPPQARNAIKKCLQTIIDRKLNHAEIDGLWHYFGASCAYCGQVLDQASRTAHVDHLVAGSMSGSNRLANRVLACSKCNGDEKREATWEEFLASKCGNNEKEFKLRRSKIANWIELNGSDQVLNLHQIELIEAACKRINAIFKVCIDELKADRNSEREHQ